MKVLFTVIMFLVLVGCNSNSSDSDSITKPEQVQSVEGDIQDGEDGKKNQENKIVFLIDEINLMLNQGNIDKAEEEALNLLNSGVESSKLFSLLGNIYQKKGDNEKALKNFIEANTLSDGKNGHILFNLGVVYSFIDTSKSDTYIKEAQKLLPDDENIKKFIENTDKNKGAGTKGLDVSSILKHIDGEDYDEAKKVAEKLYQENPNSGHLASILGNIYMKQGDNERAIEHYTQADGLSKGREINILLNLATLYSRKDNGKAMNYFQKAKALDPENNLLIELEKNLTIEDSNAN